MRDAQAALTALASAWRATSRALVLGVGGSNGKTTTKELLAAIVSGAGPTLATRGNLNNHIGVPLTLLRLEPAHRYAVVEMGANHPGEIAALASIACLRDLERTKPMSRSPGHRVYPGCNQDPGRQRVRLGTSVGWSDIYPAETTANGSTSAGCTAASPT